MAGEKEEQAKFIERFLASRIRVVWIILLLFAVGLVLFWPSYWGLGLVVVAALLLFWNALRAGQDYDRHSLEGLAAFLSCVALVLAGYWYFIERRGIPKLNVHSDIQAWPMRGNALLVRTEVRLENVGTVKYELDNEAPFRLEIGQVFPVRPAEDVNTLLEAFRAGERNEFDVYNIVRTDQWPMLAAVEGGLSTEIESGETERRYFKAIVPCSEGQVLAATAIVPKQVDWLSGFFERQDELLFWKSQSLSLPVEECRE